MVRVFWNRIHIIKTLIKVNIKIQYMKKILLLSGLLLLSLWMASCKDSLEDTTFATAEEKPVGIFLEEQPEYSEWVKLLKRTNLFNALNISKIKFTCFVADNAAVQKYLQEKGYATIDDIPLTDAIYLMRYHIIPGNAYTHSSFSGQILDTTASGDYLTVKYREGGINAMYVNDVSLIIRRDIEAINGYLHKIDKLLDPITESVWDLISQQNNYSIFQEAMEYCQLDEWLKARNKTVNEKSVRDYKTVFIVSNETFQAEGINSLEDLKNRFPSQPGTSQDSVLRQFMLYHVINSYADFGQLSEFDKDATEKTKNYVTMATDQVLSVEDLNKQLVINRYADSVLFVPNRYDQQANNGYLHEVDKIMPIAIPRPAKFIWEFTDIEDCRILSQFRSTTLGDQTRYPIDRENATEIEWFTVPDNDNAVQYNIRQSWTNRDLLWVSLGNVGWVKIKTPVIVKGTYKITIRKFNWGARGKAQVYIDDEKIGPVVNFSNQSTTPEYTVLGTKTFPENGRHWVKLVSLKSGDTEVDQLTFEPVN